MGWVKGLAKAATGSVASNVRRFIIVTMFITTGNGYTRIVNSAARRVQFAGLAIVLIADVALYLDGSLRTSFVTMQLMMLVTVFIISMSRLKLEVDKRNLDIRNRKNLKH
jgi:hypothetical protein